MSKQDPLGPALRDCLQRLVEAGRSDDAACVLQEVTRLLAPHESATGAESGDALPLAVEPLPPAPPPPPLHWDCVYCGSSAEVGSACGMCGLAWRAEGWAPDVESQVRIEAVFTLLLCFASFCYALLDLALLSAPCLLAAACRVVLACLLLLCACLLLLAARFLLLLVLM
jgi:hypothetical protein